MSNPCIRCGKERIDGKSWKGKIGASDIIYSLTLCPDPACQKIVDKAAADRKAKSDKLIQDKLKAKLEREKLIIAA